MRHIGTTEAGPECKSPLSNVDDLGDAASADCVECLRRCVCRLELDAMTGLARREVVRQRLIRLARKSVGVLLFIDIDDMKSINDQARSAGDRAITLVSGAISRCCRAQDVTGREGGDEFVIGLGPTPPRFQPYAAIMIANRIAAVVESTSGGLVTISAAAARYVPSPDGINQAIDRCLAACKVQKEHKRGGGLADFEFIPLPGRSC